MQMIDYELTQKIPYIQNVAFKTQKWLIYLYKI